MKNLGNARCQSFGNLGDKANVAFEVSSEGELEQALPYIRVYLENGKKVELIFASESVESKCLQLAEKYPEQLRIFRLPLLTYAPAIMPFGQSLERWMTADSLVLCRYDFFPELLLKGRSCRNGVYLISATLISRQSLLDRDISLAKIYWSSLYRLFDKLVSPSEQDRERFVKLGIPAQKILSAESRVLRINRRLENTEETLNKFKGIKALKEILEGVPLQKRMILGQAWPVEIDVLKDKRMVVDVEQNLFRLVVAPHRLNRESVRELSAHMTNIIHSMGLDTRVHILHPDLEESGLEEFLARFREHPGPIIVTYPGLLCELYSLFGHCHVGGGHGKSIHSVLEPYLAGCQITCGPRVHRSTEYEFVTYRSNDRLKVVRYLSNLYEEVNQKNWSLPRQTYSEVGNQMQDKFNQVLQMFGQ